MPSVAQFLGWIWVGFNGLAALYGLLSQGDVVKGLIVALVCCVIALPGLLLIIWGRRASQKRRCT